MKLGEFRNFTKDLPDDTEIINFFRIPDADYVNVPVSLPLSFICLEDKENIWNGERYSDKVICVLGLIGNIESNFALSYYKSKYHNKS